MAERTTVLRIKRQESPSKSSYWEEFEIPYKSNHNIISMLMEIRRNPVTRQGKRTTPVVFDANCLEEVCGSCTMVINGRVRQACSQLAEGLEGTTTVEPMSKFPVVRDLWVDRSKMFDYLKKAHSWIPIDGTYDLGPGPRVNSEDQQFAYLFSRCMTCGCCLEACPQVNDHSKFMGAAIIGQVYLMGQHPTGAMHQDERLEALMGEGGISDCGNAQNCVEVCPKNIPLTTAIGEVGRQTSVKWLRDLFSK
ncbi:MAG TPA: succinate dehydrogenase iron-sulfur subunit [Candidatus Binataceae bacterium]|nr:succinate dehydrogenase iron-sulfur subunit [Candidatus Binataceae bacterium]